MEDTHVLVETDDGILAAVFDGHCGKEVADMAADLFPKTFAAQRSLGQTPAEALQWTLAGLHAQSVGMPSGACVVAAHLANGFVTVANLGDAHAVLVDDLQARQLTVDHRLSNPAELARIYALGTLIQKPYYYAMSNKGPAGLMPTRTIGDHNMTVAGCSSEPYVGGANIGERARWLILACDGFSDVVEAAEVAELIKGGPNVESAANVANHLANVALNVRQTTDNLTIIAIQL